MAPLREPQPRSEPRSVWLLGPVTPPIRVGFDPTLRAINNRGLRQLLVLQIAPIEGQESVKIQALPART
eukprot:14624639-Alexandrium_andersonii.AAC.1